MDGLMDLVRAAVAAPAPAAPATALYTVPDLTYLVMFLICETNDGKKREILAHPEQSGREIPRILKEEGHGHTYTYTDM